MQWHEFIFSEKWKHKAMRHFAFWALWCLYFLTCYTLVQQPLTGGMKPFHLTPGHHLPLKTLLIVLMYACACYPVMYYLFPQLIAGKWLRASVNFILTCLFLSIASHLLYWNVFPVIDSLFGSSKKINPESRFWPAVNLGLLNFTKVAAAAISIKYVKYWWIKEKESQRLEKERINAELRLLKAQVHPDFLFKTLNNIYSHALSSSPRTSEMLLRLSDLLSYMLYECDRPEVPLEREIAMMKEYMQLEKLRHNNEPELQVSLRGDLTNSTIAPFLLLPFIENSFKYCGEMTEQSWINLDIRINGDHFSMKLTNGISEHITGQPSLSEANGLANVRKRLSLLYPGRYELRVTTEQEMFIVFLDIRLGDDAVVKFNSEEIDAAVT
jgi:sensor histidine kinase YesM